MYESITMECSLISRRQKRGSGFTLIELLIVIGIIMLLTAIVLGTITRLGSSNRRMTCQSNLSQLYQACRLYQQDEGGFPFYNDSALLPGLDQNIGLWALYTFPKTGTSIPNPAGPVGRYIRSPRMFHCPQDNATGEMSMMLSDTNYNLDYLSYQRSDGGTPSYQSIRTTDASTSNYALWKRQLVTFDGPNPTTDRIFRTPSDDTIVTWCPFHRTAVGGRDFDNVLFYDGSVQLLPRQQDDGSMGWQRTPKPPQ